ncbi:MAG: hypothetical protein JJU11_06290 [Candidatus Sumerlaeia bacterium]|nr:hypothetical protein [Candidatus Sumerlaeia bacterium]
MSPYRGTPKRVWRCDGGDFPSSIAVGGNLIAVANGEGPLILLDRATGELKRKLKGHTMGALTVNLIPGTGKFLSTGYDGHARIWEGESGEMISEMQVGRGMVELAAPSPDGALMVTTCGRILKVWSAAGDLVMESEWHPTAPSVLDWTHGGDLFATGTQGYFLTWNRKECLEKGLPETAIELSFGVTALALDPQGRWAACGSSDNGLRLIAMKEGIEDFAAGPYQHLLTTLSWSHDGRWLITPNNASLALFDSTKVGKPDPDTIQLIDSHDARVTRVLFHPVEAGVVASGDKEGRVILHDAGDGSRLAEFTAGNAAIEHLAWLDNGGLLVADEEGIIQFFQWQESDSKEEG